MALPDLTGQNIQDTYQRVVQTDGTSTYNGTGSQLPISFDGNNVIVTGTLTAQTYVVSESIINISSGSTIFGNSTDDTHQFTGSISMSSGWLQFEANEGIRFADHGTYINGNGTYMTIDGDDYVLMNGDTHLAFTAPIIYNYGIISGSSIKSNTHITASGNISASITSTITAATGSYHVLKGDTTKTTGLDISGYLKAVNITASGDISASGVVIGKSVFSYGEQGSTIGGITRQGSGGNVNKGILVLYDNSELATRIMATNDSFISGSNVRLGIGTKLPSASLTVEGNIQAKGTSGHITASGNISTSADLYFTNAYGASAVYHDNDANTGITFGLDTLIGKTNNVQNFNFSTTANRLGHTSYPTNITGSMIGFDGHITASGNISATGNISASNGNVYSKQYLFLGPGSNTIFGTYNAGVGGLWHVLGDTDHTMTVMASNFEIGNNIHPDNNRHVTASGNIYVSGSISGSSTSNLEIRSITASHNISATQIDVAYLIAEELTGTLQTAEQSAITSLGTISAFNAGSITASAEILGRTHISSSEVRINGHLTASGDISSSNFGYFGRLISKGDISGSTIEGQELISDGYITSSGNINIIDGNYQIEGINAISYQDASDTHLFGATNSFTKLRSTKGIELAAHITSSGNIEVTSYISASEFRTTGHITSSGNISASGGVFSGYDLLIARDATISRTLTVGGNISGSEIEGQNIISDSHITSSGNISASGNVIASNVYMPGGSKISFDDSLDGTDQYIQGTDHNILIDGDNYVNITADLAINANTPLVLADGIVSASSLETTGNISASGHITASGNVSASGDGSFANINIGGHITASGNISASGEIYSDNIETYHGSCRITNFAAENYSGPNVHGISRHEWNLKLAETSADNDTVAFNRQQLRTGIIIPYAFKLTGFTMFYGVNKNAAQARAQGALFVISQSQMDLNDDVSTSDTHTSTAKCTGVGQGTKGYNMHLCTGSCDFNAPAGSSIYFRVKPKHGDTVDGTTMDLNYTIQWKRIKE